MNIHGFVLIKIYLSDQAKHNSLSTSALEENWSEDMHYHSLSKYETTVMERHVETYLASNYNESKIIISKDRP